MKKIVVLFVLVIMLTLASLTAAASTPAVIDVGDSQYSVELVGSSNTWVYEIEEVFGKDLSHWGVSIPLCEGNIVSTDPPASVGYDQTTAAWLVKWDVGDAFESGLFTIVLDGNYPVTPVLVYVKTGGGSTGESAGQALVDGPGCASGPQDSPSDPQQSPTMTPGQTIPPPTDTPTNGTIPPATETPDATSVPTGTATSVPSVTATQVASPTATQGATNTPSPTSTATLPPTVTPTTTPGVDTPTATPTLTPTTHPDSRPVQHLPLMFNCLFNSHGYLECGH